MNDSNHIGLGTAAIGRPEYINIKNKPESISLDAFEARGMKVLERAYEQGVRYFDTAPGYGFAEKLVTSWVKKNKAADLSVGTKWGYTYVANFEKNAAQHEIKDHSLSKLLEQWEVSQKLLGALNYYQIHSATAETGVLSDPSVLHELDKIKQQTGVKIGITTSGENQVNTIKEALEIKVDGHFLFDSFQVTYNPLEQSLMGVLGKLKALKKVIIVKEALANGRLFSNSNYPQYEAMYDYLAVLEKKYQVGTDAIALRFVMDSIKPNIVLSGASTEKQLTENLKANNFQLEKQEIRALSKFKISPKSYWEERQELNWN